MKATYYTAAPIIINLCFNIAFLLRLLRKSATDTLKTKKVELLATILLQITSKGYRVLKAITTAQMKADHPTNIGDYFIDSV